MHWLVTIDNWIIFYFKVSYIFWNLENVSYNLEDGNEIKLKEKPNQKSENEILETNFSKESGNYNTNCGNEVSPLSDIKCSLVSKKTMTKEKSNKADEPSSENGINEEG